MIHCKLKINCKKRNRIFHFIVDFEFTLRNQMSFTNENVRLKHRKL